ncbi:MULTISPECIES: hypothetical protein [unclassified Nonomuraea]|uniref:hypothetical protein n=1 Tax=unclassified Nonomuraea TaxID=2593643 RepID=UPI003405CBE6
MTAEPQHGSWFARRPRAPQAPDRVILRICARVVPPDKRVHVANMPLGGVEVWVDGNGDRWVHYHRMARELRLAGWHTEVAAERLMVLGWSAECLVHRVRMLDAALAGRLSDYTRTARAAFTLGTRLREQKVPADEIAMRVRDHVGRELRWPDRLAELDGLERTASLEPLRLRLAQVTGLEAKVSRRCAEHLTLASQVVMSLLGPDAGRSARPWTRAPGRLVGITERMVAASVPNRPEVPRPETVTVARRDLAETPR